MTREPPLLVGLVRGGGAVARAWEGLAAAEARIGAILRGLDGVTVLGGPGWESLIADAHGAVSSLADALDRRAAARASGAHRRIEARPRDAAQDTPRAMTIRPSKEVADEPRPGSGRIRQDLAPEGGTPSPASPRPPKREHPPVAATRQPAFVTSDPVLLAASARRIPTPENAAGAWLSSSPSAGDAQGAGGPDMAGPASAPVMQRLERVLARIERPQVAVDGNVARWPAELQGLGDRTSGELTRDPRRAPVSGPDGWPARPSSASEPSPSHPTPSPSDASDGTNAAPAPAAEAGRRTGGASFPSLFPPPAGTRAPPVPQPSAGAERDRPSAGWPDVAATTRAIFTPGGGLPQPGASGLMRLLQRAEARGLVPPASAVPGRRVDGPGAVSPDRTPERADIAAGAGRAAWPWSEAAPPVAFEDPERLRRALGDLLRREARAAGIDLDGGNP